MSDRIHIYPVHGRNKSDHWTGKKGFCWCDPDERNVCPESDEKGNCKAGCFRCGGSGLVEIYDPELNVLIIHKPGQLNDNIGCL